MMDIDSSEIGILSIIFTLIILIPSISVTFRRLQDRGFTGWGQLSYLILDGIVVVPVICVLPAKEDENKWGRNPLITE